MNNTAELIVHPGGREPGSDDDAENDDEEGPLVASSVALEMAMASTWQEQLATAMADFVAQQGGAFGVLRDRPLFESSLGLIGADLPRTSWLQVGLVTLAAVIIVGGEPKSTKTWAALELLLSVSTGTKAFGEFAPGPRPRHVAAFLTEDGLASYRNRVLALAAGRHMKPEVAFKRMHHRCMASIDLRSVSDCVTMIASLRMLPEPPAIVMIDPMRDNIGDAEENDSAEMSKVMHNLRIIRNITGCAVMLVHHAGKASKDSAGRRAGQKLRGSSAIHGALDCGLYLQDTHGNMQTNWKNTVAVEVKSARGAGIFGLELDVVDDEEGAAKVAGWHHYKDPDDMDPPDEDAPKKPRDDGEGRMLSILRDEWHRAKTANREAQGITTKTIAETMGRAQGSVRKWAASLIEKGAVAHSGDGLVYRGAHEQ